MLFPGELIGLKNKCDYRMIGEFGGGFESAGDIFEGKWAFPCPVC